MGKNTTEMQSAKLRLWKITQQITWLPEGKREKGRERGRERGREQEPIRRFMPCQAVSVRALYLNPDPKTS